MTKAESADYAQRSKWNIRESDGTLILCPGTPITGGTAYTSGRACRLEKACEVIYLLQKEDLMNRVLA